jgi:hypothetical protein
MKSTGIKTAASDRVIDRMVKPISRPPFKVPKRRVTFFHVTDDVFQDDDGIIDSESHRQNQRHQRKLFTLNPSKYITQKVPMMDGMAALGIKVAHTLRKDENHQHDQAHRQHQGELNVIQGLAY